jgi:osmoprotectant transport system substrate-binding protein
MKRFIFLPMLGLALLWAPLSDACVGRVLYIGITPGAGEKVLAEMTSLLINERTGTAVKIQSFRNSGELYSAMKQGKVSLMIESADHALELLHRPKEANPKAAFDLVKSEYKKSMNLVWFDQFGGSYHFAPVLSADTLSNYPALPKLINKLAGVLNDDSFGRLSRSADSEEKLKKAARDFLKSKKLI